MKKLALIIVILAAGLPLLPGTPAHASPFPQPATTAEYVPGQVIVKFHTGATGGERTNALRRRDARVIRSLPLSGARLVGISASADVKQAAAALARDPSVAWAEPNTIQRGGSVPNDPLFTQQWGLHNTGQTVEGVAGTAAADIRAPEAWDRTTGSPAVKVAVVDSGITFGSPDLAPNIWTNPGETGGGREHNGIDDDRNGFVDDSRGWDFVQNDANPTDNFGHGTHVAGIIGARGNDGVGVAGVDWNASIMPVRVLNNLNLGTCADIAAGFTYAARAGARVVNASIWSHAPCRAEEDAVAAAPDTLFVFIAGNDGGDDDASPVYPCSFPEANIVCVAATGSSDQLADFSSYGASNVDLAAPGVSIESTFPKWQPLQTLWSDGFEQPLSGRWATGGSPNTWARTTENAQNGSYSLTDSPGANYANGADSFAEPIQGLDLRNREDCVIRAQVQHSLGSGDLLLGEVSTDGSTLSEATVVDGFSPIFQKSYFDLAPLDGTNTGRFLFNLVADGSGVWDGVWIDDVAVICAPPATSYTGAADEYTFDYGTSMAAPYVAGVAALVLSVDPGMSPAAVKSRILGTVDRVPGLTGTVATGGRLDAARAVDLPRPPATGGRAATLARAAIRSALAKQVRALRRVVSALRHGRLLERGSFVVALKAPSAGRLTVMLRAKDPRGPHRLATIAIGSRSTSGPGRVALKVALTRKGRRILKTRAKTQVTVTLRFAARSGVGASRSAKLTLR